jgi:hypothetical protein
MQHAISNEKLQTPTAPVFTDYFQDLAEYTALQKGMPPMGGRASYTIHPVTYLDNEQARQIVLGTDTINNRPLIDSITLALTSPLTAEEAATGTIEVTRERLLEPDTEANLKKFFYEQGWCDGLPLLLPTEERVAEMLTGTSHPADEVVGTLRPSGAQVAWSLNVEKVAVNAVMAGARPEHFPAILALAATGQPCLPSSTSSMSRMAVFNGPIRHELDMNMGIGAMGPFKNEACALIGRSWQFVSRNLGGSYPGTTYMGTMGNNLNYINVLFAEKEEALPEGWLPYNVEQGLTTSDSTVQVISGWYPFHYSAYNPWPYSETMRLMFGAFEFSGTSFHHTPDKNVGVDFTVIMDPCVAEVIRTNEGFATKEDLSQWFYGNFFYSMRNYWSAFPSRLEKAQAGEEPYASMLELPDCVPSPELAMRNPPCILVAGGGSNPYWSINDGRPRGACVKIDDWK